MQKLSAFEHGLGLFAMSVLAAVPVGQFLVAQFPISFEAIQTAECLVLAFCPKRVARQRRLVL